MGAQKDLVERGCAIAATVYEGLAAHFRREWMLWAFAEEAMAMIEEDKPDEAVLAVLWKLYASEFEAGYREEGVFLHELPLVEEKAIIRKGIWRCGAGWLYWRMDKSLITGIRLPTKHYRGWYIPLQTLLDGAQERQRAGPG